MVTTNDPALAGKINMLRNHGASVPEEQRHSGPRPYLLPDFNLLGFNYRMTDMQGAVGLVQLSKLDRLIAGRQRWADYYASELAAVRWLRTPQVPSGWIHGWQAYVCYVDESMAPHPRNEIMDALQNDGISTRPGTHAVHMLGYYKERFGLEPAHYPAAWDCDRYTIALPLHNRMSDEDFRYIVQQVKNMG